MPGTGWVPNRGSLPRVGLALLIAIATAHGARVAAGSPAAGAIDVRLPADIVYPFPTGPDSAVVFRHSTHVEMANPKCTGCHPRPFLMLSPTHRTSHAVMNAGGSCGSCHDGKRAFAVRDASSCRSCHSGRPARRETLAKGSGPAASTGGPQPIRYARSESSPGRVTFRHETHLRGKSCASCHPAPFRMKALASQPAAMHGGCGKCHDGKLSFGVEDAAKCSRCHVETKGTP